MRFKSLHNVITVFLVSLLLLFTTEVFAENKKEKKEKAKRAQKLKNFKASINSKINLDDYNFHQKIYVLNHDFKTVWNKYSSLKPQQSWKGPLAIYKQSYSKSEDVFYESSSKNHPSLKLGNVYFIKLKINGEDHGLYVLEESFDKVLVERNKRRNS